MPAYGQPLFTTSKNDFMKHKVPSLTTETSGSNAPPNDSWQHLEPEHSIVQGANYVKNKCMEWGRHLLYFEWLYEPSVQKKKKALYFILKGAALTLWILQDT